MACFRFLRTPLTPPPPPPPRALPELAPPLVLPAGPVDWDDDADDPSCCCCCVVRLGAGGERLLGVGACAFAGVVAAAAAGMVVVVEAAVLLLLLLVGNMMILPFDAGVVTALGVVVAIVAIGAMDEDDTAGETGTVASGENDEDDDVTTTSSEDSSSFSPNDSIESSSMSGVREPSSDSINGLGVVTVVAVVVAVMTDVALFVPVRDLKLPMANGGRDLFVSSIGGSRFVLDSVSGGMCD